MNSHSGLDRRSYKQTPTRFTPIREDYTDDNGEHDGDEPGIHQGDEANYSRQYLYTGHSISEDEAQINEILRGLRNKLHEIESYISRKEDEKAGIIDDIKDRKSVV